ncbi:MAG: hypothetical protein JW927_07630 [Deltaproteobacteria bacterium]|nr:hypothetical protein [Deltaproteobacteria bacterium]
MKRIRGKEVENILGLFREVHKDKENLVVSDGSKTGVMGLIRKGKHLQNQTGYFDMFQQFVWKLAPATCALAIFLCYMLSQTNVISDYEFVKFFFADPSDLSFFSLYNV